MKKFDQLCNRLLQEQYTITAREVLYKRYGKNVADSMIAKIKARGRDRYLEKKYALPDYSNKNLDKVIPVVFADLGTNEVAAEAMPKFPMIPQNIRLNFNSKYISPTIKELEGGEASYQYQDGSPSDVLGHETTHTLQKGRIFKDHPLQYEIATVLGEIKRWYYRQTGILLDADATDAQINAFIDYCNKRNIFNNVAYGRKINFEKLLRTSEGKEVFRRIVKQTPMKSDTMVA